MAPRPLRHGVLWGSLGEGASHNILSCNSYLSLCSDSPPLSHAAVAWLSAYKKGCKNDFYSLFLIGTIL